MQNRVVTTRFLLVLGLLVSLWAGAPVLALPVSGLYSQDIPVANQTEAERRRAYREALSAVFVKVTGSTQWLDHPRIRSALASADSLVAEVSYRAVAGQGMMDVRFDQAQIDDLLHRENIPVWDNNRASVLLWITVQGDDGRRTMLGSSSEHELLAQALEFAELRAVPVLVPLLDLEDRRLVTPDQAWALDSVALQAAAERYAADSVLAARLLQTADGQIVGLWKFLFRNNEEVFDQIGSGPTGLMQMPLDLATTRLASHFGLVLSQFEQRDSVLLRIDNIGDLASQQQLLQYLQSLTVVRGVVVAGLRPDSLDVRVDLAGTRQMLSEFISLGRDLRSVNFEPGSALPDTLHYRWTR